MMQILKAEHFIGLKISLKIDHQVRFRGVCAETVDIESRTPQGSAISPVLFNEIINVIFQKVHPSFGKSLFEDHGVIWRRGRNIGHLFLQTQMALDQVVQ